jgi:hypothetical protein
MARSLGGSLFIFRGETFDYCYKEAIQCLKNFCDKVAIIDAGSDDGTAEIVKSFEDDKTKVLCLSKDVWDSQHGKEKLSTFSNIAHGMLDTDYFFNLQGDEILSEHSYDAVRRAIETDQPGYLCTRLNLWKDCNHMLNVPQERKPCSTQVIRLAKHGAFSFDDAENLCTPATADFLNDIVIWHYGFVRKKDIMKQKVIHMQKQIFGMDHDKKLDGSPQFDWSQWFSDEDLIPVPGEHPALMREWISNRP